MRTGLDGRRGGLTPLRLPAVRAVSLLPLLTLLACASGRGGRAPLPGQAATSAETTTRPGLQVVVKNDIIPSEPLTIYLVTVGGERIFLGTVPPNGRATLPYRQGDLSGQRYLEAEGRSDQVLFRSQVVSLMPGDVLQWSLPSNALSIDAGG